jgi:hypothetical protein
MTIDNNPLLKECAAADRLGVCVSTLRRWRWAGSGPEWIKLGGAVRYAPEALARYIAICRRPVPKQPNAIATVGDQKLNSCM